MYPSRITHVLGLLGLSFLLLVAVFLVYYGLLENNIEHAGAFEAFLVVSIPFSMVHAYAWWHNRKCDFDHLTASRAYWPLLALLLVVLLLVEVAEVLRMNFNTLNPYARGSWSDLLPMVVMGPVFEEWIFRDIYLKGLLASGHYKKWVAVAFVSALFAIAHFDVTQGLAWNNMLHVLYTLLVGVGLSVLYMKFGSLVLNALFHMTLNGLGVTLSLWFSSCEPVSWSVAGGFVLFGLTIPVMYFVLKRLWFLS